MFWLLLIGLFLVTFPLNKLLLRKVWDLIYPPDLYSPGGDFVPTTTLAKAQFTALAVFGLVQPTLAAVPLFYGQRWYHWLVCTLASVGYASSGSPRHLIDRVRSSHFMFLGTLAVFFTAGLLVVSRANYSDPISELTTAQESVAATTAQPLPPPEKKEENMSETAQGEPLRVLLRRQAEESFAVAHEFVAVRDHIIERAGTLTSLFKQVDFDRLLRDATSIRDRIRLRADDVHRLAKDIGASVRDAEKGYLALNVEYVEALLNAAEIQLKKMELAQRIAHGDRLVGWQEFQSVGNDEIRALEKCQRLGDALTAMYRTL